MTRITSTALSVRPSTALSLISSHSLKPRSASLPAPSAKPACSQRQNSGIPEETADLSPKRFGPKRPSSRSPPEAYGASGLLSGWLRDRNRRQLRVERLESIGGDIETIGAQGHGPLVEDQREAARLGKVGEDPGESLADLSHAGIERVFELLLQLLGVLAKLIHLLAELIALLREIVGRQGGALLRQLLVGIPEGVFLLDELSLVSVLLFVDLSANGLGRGRVPKDLLDVDDRDGDRDLL